MPDSRLHGIAICPGYPDSDTTAAHSAGHFQTVHSLCVHWKGLRL